MINDQSIKSLNLVKFSLQPLEENRGDLRDLHSFIKLLLLLADPGLSFSLAYRHLRLFAHWADEELLLQVWHL